jgi:hypothetical protein
MDFSILHIDATSGRVSLRLSHKTVKGLQKLVQMVILGLLNTPGKDILDPEEGGGIPELVGFGFDVSDLTEVVTEVTRRVRKVETEIINNQIGLEIDPTERLEEIQILRIGAGEALDEVDVRIRVENELGQQIDVVL